MEARGRRPSIPHLGASGLDLIFPVSYLTGLNLSWKARRTRRGAEKRGGARQEAEKEGRSMKGLSFFFLRTPPRPPRRRGLAGNRCAPRAQRLGRSSATPLRTFQLRASSWPSDTRS